jgi:hypothetical protein
LYKNLNSNKIIEQRAVRFFVGGPKKDGTKYADKEKNK